MNLDEKFCTVPWFADKKIFNIYDYEIAYIEFKRFVVYSKHVIQL